MKQLIPAVLVAAVGTACGGDAPRQGLRSPERGPLFAESYVPVEGLRLYARIVGNGPDTVIVPASMYLARDFARLAEGRTLIFYDLRSRGASDVVLDPTRLGVDHDVADLEAVRAYFRVPRVSVVGWSYLGAVVALYAAKYPGHVERVVQIGPVAPRTETSRIKERRGSAPSPENLAHLESLRQAGKPVQDPVGYCRDWLTLEMLPSIMGRPEAVSRSSMDPCLYWNEWPDRVFRTLGKVWPPNQPDGRWDFTPQAALVRVPVLIVHGTRDPSAPIEGGRDWAAHFAKPRLLELEGVGHLPWLEAPDRFFAEVDAFLQGK